MEQRCYEYMVARDFDFGAIKINIITQYVMGKGVLVWNDSDWMQKR